MQQFTELRNIISKKYSKEISSIGEYYGELILHTEINHLISLMQGLRDDKKLLFNMLIDICVVDYIGREKRFEVVYNMLSIEHNSRVRIKLHVNDDEIIPSLTSLFSAAGWYEREAWDLYGILFENHKDLRRILTDYNFIGHPMRKDFPLTGHNEVRYDVEKMKVIYEPVKLTQEFRNFDFQSPWEGQDYILPGDEKVSK